MKKVVTLLVLVALAAVMAGCHCTGKAATDKPAGCCGTCGGSPMK